MPVSVNWFDVEETILLYTFEGNWTWKEFRETDEPIWDLIANADCRIDIFVDLTTINKLPLGVQDIFQMEGEGAIPTKEGEIIMIGASLLMKILVGSFRRLYPQMGSIYHLVDTYQEAIQLLEKLRGESISAPK